MKIEMSKAEEEEARLTGYALGELDAAETEAVEALLESSAEAREMLEQIRATADLLSAEFSKEPPLSLREEQVDAITGDGKVVHGNFFSRHRSFISTGAVAACACLFAAVGLKPYLTGIEDKAAVAPELESMPSLANGSELGKGYAKGAPQPDDAGANEGSPAIVTSHRKEMAPPSGEAPGLREKKMASEPSMDKEIVSSAITAEGERRQLGRLSESGAAANDSSSRPPMVEPSSRPAAPAPGARPKAAPQKARDSDVFAEGLSRGVITQAPAATAPPAPAEDFAMVPTDPASLGGRAAEGAKRETEVRAKPSAKTRSVVESRNFGLESADGVMPDNESKKSKLGQEFDLDERAVAELVKRRVAPKPADNIASGESYGQLVDNPWVSTWEDGLSTFAIDVDTGTYPNLRRFLKRRASLPPRDAVRIEEMVNYFNYDYPEPVGSEPFSVNMEVASCPWAKDHRLLRVGLRGKGVEVDKRPPSNLVFLIDVSGSMRGNDKLELLRRSMKAMVSQLNEDDRIGIVTYAGESGVALEPTHGDQKGKITGVLDKLGAGGSTNGAAGIMTAYSLAMANFVEGGTNRVILATDGDFNVGVTGNGDLIRMVEERAREKIFLTVLGVGEGNLQEHRMEQIADKGNGSYHYLDSEAEGEKVLVRGLGATLVTVAKDVKVQIDFNPAAVEKYRLIGYANRMMPDEAFNDPAADAGEIGAGHTVTALYEIVPAAAGADPGGEASTASRYREQGGLVESRDTLTLSLKYKKPEGDDPEPKIEVPLVDGGKDWAESSEDFRFAAAVAGFGLLLRESDYAGLLNYDLVLELGREGVPENGDRFGLRSEFIELVEVAKSLSAAKE